jgi:hypothetical protein
MSRHTLQDRDDGLAYCTTCRGGESSLPIDCPGRPMAEAEQDAVSDGRLQFKCDKWFPIPAR